MKASVVISILTKFIIICLILLAPPVVLAGSFSCSTPSSCPPEVPRRTWSCADTWVRCGSGDSRCGRSCTDDCCAGGGGASWTKIHTLFRLSGEWIREKDFTSVCGTSQYFSDLYFTQVKVKETDGTWIDPNRSRFYGCYSDQPQTILQHASTETDPRDWQISTHPISGYTCTWIYKDDWAGGITSSGSGCSITLTNVPFSDRPVILFDLNSSVPTPTEPLTPPPTPTPTTPTLPPAGGDSWFQTVDGDVHADVDLLPRLPDAADFSLASLDGAVGIVSYGRDFDRGQGRVSASGWLAKTKYHGRRYDYSYFNTNLEPDQSLTGSQQLSSLNLAGNRIFKIDGDLTIDSDLAANLGVKIFLVSGLVSIETDLQSADSVAVFISSGNIEIDPKVRQVKAVLISSGRVKTGQATEDETLIIQGYSVSWGNFKLERKRQNNDLPAEKFIFDPEIFFQLATFLGKPRYTWQEVVP